VRCVLDCMKIVCRLLVAMAILTVGLVQVSLAAESNDPASAYHRAEQSVARSALLTRCLNLCYAVNESSNA
jgi:hypothetical protein